MDNKTIHVKNRKRLEQFAKNLQKLLDNPPVRITPEEWAQAIPYLERGEGDPPPQSVMDRIGVVGDGGTVFADSDIDGTDSKYYDRSWENWNKAFINLFDTYDDVIQELRAAAGIDPDRELDIIDVCNLIAAIEEEQAGEQGEYRLNLHLFDNEQKDNDGEWNRMTNAPIAGHVLTLIASRGRGLDRTPRRGKDGLTYNADGRQTKTRLTLVSDDFFDKTFKNDMFNRLFVDVFQKWDQQHQSNDIVIDTRDLVERGFFSRTDAASRSLDRFFDQQSKLVVEGTIETEDGEIIQDRGILFFNIRHERGRVILSLNTKINADYFARFSMLFPKWADNLGNRAHDALWHIFSYIRQEAPKAKAATAEGLSVRMKLDTLREKIGLPSVEEERNKNRRYKEHIIDPLVGTIKEIQEVYEYAVKQHEASPGLGIVIEPDVNAKYTDFLNGYLAITLTNVYADPFMEIATRQKQAKALASKNTRNRRKNSTEKGATK